MKRIVAAALVVAFAGFAGVARAEDKANPAGTWKWSVTRGNNTRDFPRDWEAGGNKLWQSRGVTPTSPTGSAACASST